MVTSLFRYERITTTKAKALEVRRFAEKLITRGKVDSVHNRRQAARFIQDEIVLAKLFKDIGPRMQDRNGGYTRIMKLGFRQGDAADMAILELVDYKLDTGKSSEKKAEKAKKAEKTEKPAAATAEKKPAAKKTTSAKKPASASAKKTGETAAKKPAAKKTAKAAPAKEESAPAENKE
jgi:large subunit ribosomal protein L17